MLKHAFPFFLLFSLLFSCSGQGLDQDGGDLTRGEVEVLSRHMAKAIEAEYPLLRHRLVNRYVTALGQSIVSHNPQMPPLPYEFRVLRTNEVFVTSLPGGIVYLSLGTLRSVEIEGQLAAALAHELAHQQLNHPLVQWRRKVNANRGQANLLEFRGDWKDEFLGPGGALYLDRAMEEEAESLAPIMLYRARFDPRVYISYLQLLKNLEEKDKERIGAMASLHPPIALRLTWAKESLAKLQPLKDPQVSSQTFQEIKGILKEAVKRAADGKAE